MTKKCDNCGKLISKEFDVCKECVNEVLKQAGKEENEKKELKQMLN